MVLSRMWVTLETVIVARAVALRTLSWYFEIPTSISGNFGAVLRASFSTTKVGDAVKHVFKIGFFRNMLIIFVELSNICLNGLGDEGDGSEQFLCFCEYHRGAHTGIQFPD